MFVFFKQNTAYEMRISDWSSDVCSSDLSEADFAKLSKRLPESYWIAEPEDILIHNAQHILEAGDSPLSIAAQYYPQRGATLVTVYAADHPGLFRSEEHTSELQSLMRISYAVFCLKKKKYLY